MVWTGDDFGVVWQAGVPGDAGNSDLLFVRTGTDGGVDAPPENLTRAPGFSGFEGFAWNGREFGIVFADARETGDEREGWFLAGLLTCP